MIIGCGRANPFRNVVNGDSQGNHEREPGVSRRPCRNGHAFGKIVEENAEDEVKGRFLELSVVLGGA